jgi:hypothetical protein
MSDQTAILPRWRESATSIRPRPRAIYTVGPDILAVILHRMRCEGADFRWGKPDTTAQAAA